MDNFHIDNKTLQYLENQLREFQTKLIKGIAQNIMHAPDKIPEMLAKYKKKYEEPIIKPIDISDEDNEDDSDDELTYPRCICLVNKKGETKQCKGRRLKTSDFCGTHDTWISYPFGTLNNPK